MSVIQADLMIRANRIMTEAGEISGCVVVRDGAVVAVEPSGSLATADTVVELHDDEVLLPGVVDSHVHVNDPGRSAWEGFTSATRAAAAGGVTTIVDMPLNSLPPTVDVAALKVKRKTAEPQAYVDVGFWGGAVPGNVSELRPLHDAGVFGFKCFLLHSGVDEFAPLSADQLESAAREIASFDGLLIVHAEDSQAIDAAPTASGRSYGDFLRSRPRGAENLAVAQVVEVSRQTGCRVHILHVSSAETLPVIASARAEGIAITAETCPHYLSFSAEEIPDGATTFKCCPPIREADNREQLWDGLGNGTIDAVVTDHSPSTPDLKRLDDGDFGAAWGGIASLQLGLSAVWTQARRRGYGLADVTRWMCQGPARLTGLSAKGRIAAGYDADFCVFAPDDTFTVDPRLLEHKNPITAYAGHPLTGAVRATWLRGQRVDLHAEPRGRLMSRGES